MILHSVRVENYKGIREPLEIDLTVEFPNLVEGPNGAGKSTLVEAAQTCLFESHNTAGASAEGMRPRGTALTPSVSVVFEHGGSVYRISKTFLDSPKATLERRRPDGGYDQIAKGKAADEKVRELLRSQATKAKDRPGERYGIFSILCASQGEDHLPELSGDVLADIRCMLGAQLSGRRGVAFEKLIEKRHSAVWTPGGKPKKGALTDIQSKLQEARGNLQTCSALMTQAAEKEASARQQRGRSEATMALLRAARQELERFQPVADEVIAVRARHAPAVSRLDAADATYRQQRSELDRILELTGVRRACEEAQPELVRAEADVSGARDRARQRADAARDAWEIACRPNAQVGEIEARIERGIAFLEAGRNLEELRNRVGRSRTATETVTQIEQQISDLNAPDPDVWTEVQNVARELGEASVRVDALALRFDIAAETDLAAEVVTGTPAGLAGVQPGETLRVSGEGQIEVRLPGIATLRLAGPAGDAAQWRVKRDQASAKLQALLEPFQAAKWQDLADRVRGREGLSARLVRAQAELLAALGRDQLDDLVARQQTLDAGRTAIAAVEPSWAVRSPDLAAMRTAVAGLKQNAETAQSQARSEWQAAEKLRDAAESALSDAARARSMNEIRLAEANQQLAPLTVDGLSVTERQNPLAERRREWESAQDGVRTIETALANLPADAPERAEEIRQRIGTLDTEIQSAREAYQQDEAVVRTILLQGPYTSLAVAEERVLQLEQDETAERLRLDAIQRLKNAVDTAKANALAGIAEPVEKRATELLERISGGPLARVRLGNGMEILSVEPAASGGDACIEEMSAGEQEQIYFATRVALADVLAGGERQVLVFDDPLVNTDADRFGRALRLLDEKRDHFQYVILTCHPGRYIELPNAVSRSIESSVAAAVNPGGTS
jgi:DNA repair exonuclease SbcCD ATPase subunit